MIGCHFAFSSLTQALSFSNPFLALLNSHLHHSELLALVLEDFFDFFSFFTFLAFFFFSSAEAAAGSESLAAVACLDDFFSALPSSELTLLARVLDLEDLASPFSFLGFGFSSGVPDLSLGEADLSFLPLRLLAGVLPDLLLSFLFLCGGGDTLARLFLGGGEAEGLRFLTLRCGDLLRLALDFLCPPRFGEELGVDFLLSGDQLPDADLCLPLWGGGGEFLDFLLFGGDPDPLLFGGGDTELRLLV